MEVADQWRREWAGKAEYGKVTEGGVTRRIARAMEVLHASGPGARVRVLRAAYHSSAGPGVPAASYMLHSSRRVLTSGFNFMDQSSLPPVPSKPLEISSTSIDSSPDSHTETENYKVTEPDDLEISEPSKWRGSSGINSIRMPSEESSSTDNASIIDLDVRTSKGLHRKYSYDSESSDVQWNNKNNARSSPFLDAPVTLNTLKYKSLLNSSSEWNARRKSYSFEDTSPMSDASPFKNYVVAMESSTDSGICKSTEVVNDTDNSSFTKKNDQQEKKSKAQDESFQEWLSKNRLNSFYKGTKYKPHREHDTVLEHPSENKTDNNIIIQSSGKVSITLPVNIETDDSQHKKVKKVEFCKTELHVAVDTGEVNIISTDDKPPPSNDFRKRRSAFVPMLDVPEKSITLFGDKFNDSSESIQIGDILKRTNGEFGEIDENTAATKSILKNKIPKPKPYLLGENMAFGSSNISNEDRLNENSSVRTAVSLINKQLHVERLYSDGLKSRLMEHTENSARKTSAIRTIAKGPSKDDKFDIQDTPRHNLMKPEKTINGLVEGNHIDLIRDKFYGLQTSPQQNRSKSRHLRQSELSYFGVGNQRKKNMDHSRDSDNKTSSDDSVVEDIFHSVKLVKKISNSVCSSEAESEDTPQYQNIPLNTTYTPVPTPRLHSKQYDIMPNRIDSTQKVKTIADKDREGSTEISVPVPITRRPRLRKQEEHISHTSRSLSEPPKGYNYNSLDKTPPSHNQCSRSKKCADKIGNKQSHKLSEIKVSPGKNRKISEESIPIYENLDDVEPIYQALENRSSGHRSSLRDTVNKFLPKKICHQQDNSKPHSRRISNENDYAEIERLSDNENNSFKKTRCLNNRREVLQKLTKTDKNRSSRDCKRETDKRLTPSQNFKKTTDDKTPDEDYLIKNKHGNRSVSAQRNTDKTKHNGEVTTKTNGHISRVDNKVMTPKVENIIRHRKKINEKKTHTNEPLQQKQHKSDHKDASSASPQIKYNAKNSPQVNTNTKSGSHRTSRRNEYVINYDDKKGTVSSVCKIKTGPGGTRTKKVSSDMIDETPIETVVRHKTINKIALRK